MAVFCPKCGSEVTKTFCTKCGTRMPMAEPKPAAVPEDEPTVGGYAPKAEPAPAAKPIAEKPVEEKPVAAAKPIERKPVEEKPVAAAKPIERKPVEEKPVAAAKPIAEMPVVSEKRSRQEKAKSERKPERVPDMPAAGPEFPPTPGMTSAIPETEPEKPKKARSLAAVVGAIMLIICTIAVVATAVLAFMPAEVLKIVDFNAQEAEVIKESVKGCLPYVLIFDGAFLVVSLVALFISFNLRKSRVAAVIMLVQLLLVVAATAIFAFIPIKALGIQGMATRTLVDILTAGKTSPIFVASLILLVGWGVGCLFWIISFLLFLLGGGKEKKIKAKEAE